MSNDSIKLDSRLASISNNSIVKKQLRNISFGYTVVLISAKRNFLIWMWANSVLYSGYRNERRKLYFSWLFSNIV